MMINEKIIGNDMEGSVCGLMWGSIATFEWRELRKTVKKVGQLSRSSGRDLNPWHPEYETDKYHWNSGHKQRCESSPWWCMYVFPRRGECMDRGLRRRSGGTAPSAARWTVTFVHLKAAVYQLVGCVCPWLQHMTGLRALLCVVMVTGGEFCKVNFVCFCTLYYAPLVHE
jgi:hypothetical protein